MSKCFCLALLFVAASGVLFGQTRPTGTEYHTVYASANNTVLYGETSLETSTMNIPPGTTIVHTVTAAFTLQGGTGAKTSFQTIQSGGPQQALDPVAFGNVPIAPDTIYTQQLDDVANCNYFGNFFDDAGVISYIEPPYINTGGVVDSATDLTSLTIGHSGYLSIYGTALEADGTDLTPTITVDDTNIQLTLPISGTDEQVNIAYNVGVLAQVGTHNLYVTTPAGKSNAGTFTVKAAQTFTVYYQAWIPYDHILGFSSCFFSPYNITYLYNGNSDSGTFGGYKAMETIQVTPDTAKTTGFSQDSGQTWQYGYGSPKNGYSLSSSDLDFNKQGLLVYNDCYLFNNTAKAPANFSYSVTFPYPHQAQVVFSGAATNPLEFVAGPIQWNMRTVIDTTNPSKPTAYVNYNVTCFPAHEIVVNTTRVYYWPPASETLSNVAGCLGTALTPPTNPKQMGQTTPPAVLPGN